MLLLLTNCFKPHVESDIVGLYINFKRRFVKRHFLRRIMRQFCDGDDLQIGNFETDRIFRIWLQNVFAQNFSVLIFNPEK